MKKFRFFLLLTVLAWSCNNADPPTQFVNPDHPGAQAAKVVGIATGGIFPPEVQVVLDDDTTRVYGIFLAADGEEVYYPIGKRVFVGRYKYQ